MSTVQKTVVVLESPRDWKAWFGLIREHAKATGIWKFVNPCTEGGRRFYLSMPPMLFPVDINPNKGHFDELTPEEQKELTTRNAEQEREFRRQEMALTVLRTVIYATVSPTYYGSLFGSWMLSDTLFELEQQAAPRDEKSEIERAKLRRKLAKQRRYREIKGWMDYWEESYRSYNQAELLTTDALYKLLDAVQPFAPAFAALWRVELKELEFGGRGMPDFYEILGHFKHYMLKEGGAARMTGLPFSDDESEQEKKGKKGRPCLCGKMHRFKACWYLIEFLRPAAWNPDPKVQRQIEEELKKSSRLRGTIRRIQNEALNKKKEKDQWRNLPKFLVSVFHSELSDYKLHKSVIMDLGATIHVCNDLARMVEYKPTSEEALLYSGKKTFPIEGFGTATVTITEPDGKRDLLLTDVAFVPSLHTSVVSALKFAAYGIEYNFPDNVFCSGYQRFCTLEYHHGHSTVEFKEVSTYALLSQIVPQATMLDSWYERQQQLLHTEPEKNETKKSSQKRRRARRREIN